MVLAFIHSLSLFYADLSDLTNLQKTCKDFVKANRNTILCIVLFVSPSACAVWWQILTLITLLYYILLFSLILRYSFKDHTSLHTFNNTGWFVPCFLLFDNFGFLLIVNDVFVCSRCWVSERKAWWLMSHGAGTFQWNHCHSVSVSNLPNSHMSTVCCTCEVVLKKHNFSPFSQGYHLSMLCIFNN